jgi:hypothetical protein
MGPAVTRARCSTDRRRSRRRLGTMFYRRRRSRRRLGTMFYRPQTVPTPFGHDVLSTSDNPGVDWVRRSIDPSRSPRRLARCSIDPSRSPRRLARCSIDLRQSRRRLGTTFHRPQPVPTSSGTMFYRSQTVPPPSGHDVLSTTDGPGVVWARCSIDLRRSRRRLRTMRHRPQMKCHPFAYDAASIASDAPWSEYDALSIANVPPWAEYDASSITNDTHLSACDTASITSDPPSWACDAASIAHAIRRTD